MRLLLDTHILLWAAGKAERLSPAGKSDFGAEPGVLRRTLIENGYVELPVTGVHAAATSALPPIHKDPFDRLLLAQAICEGITLITADETLASYPGPVRKV